MNLDKANYAAVGHKMEMRQFEAQVMFLKNKYQHLLESLENTHTDFKFGELQRFSIEQLTTTVQA